jgi:hypothetical protein
MIRLKQTLRPGVCRAWRCTAKPRNVGTHPTSTQLCGGCYKAEWRAKNPERAAYGQQRDHARARRIPFTLSFDEWWAVVEPTGYMDGKGCLRHQLHVDRLDPSKGYEVGNIRVITCTENVVRDNRRRFVDAKIAAWHEKHDADDSDLVCTDTPDDEEPF